MSNIINYKNPSQQYYLNQIKKNNIKQNTTIQSKRSLFQGMMIERIQNIRPGCGSCGH